MTGRRENGESITDQPRRGVASLARPIASAVQRGSRAPKGPARRRGPAGRRAARKGAREPAAGARGTPTGAVRARALSIGSWWRYCGIEIVRPHVDAGLERTVVGEGA